MTDEEIRAKSLEIAVLIQGQHVFGGATKDSNLILGHYLFLADAVEQRIRNAKSTEEAERTP